MEFKIIVQPHRPEPSHFTSANPCRLSAGNHAVAGIPDRLLQQLPVNR